MNILLKKKSSFGEISVGNISSAPITQIKILNNITFQESSDVSQEDNLKL